MIRHAVTLTGLHEVKEPSGKPVEYPRAIKYECITSGRRSPWALTYRWLGELSEQALLPDCPALLVFPQHLLLTTTGDEACSAEDIYSDPGQSFLCQEVNPVARRLSGIRKLWKILGYQKPWQHGLRIPVRMPGCCVLHCLRTETLTLLKGRRKWAIRLEMLIQ